MDIGHRSDEGLQIAMRSRYCVFTLLHSCLNENTQAFHALLCLSSLLVGSIGNEICRFLFC